MLALVCYVSAADGFFGLHQGRMHGSCWCWPPFLPCRPAFFIAPLACRPALPRNHPPGRQITQPGAPPEQAGSLLDACTLLPAFTLPPGAALHPVPSHPAPAFSSPQLVDEHWVVKLSDFNLSKVLESTQGGSSTTGGGANNPLWLVSICMPLQCSPLARCSLPDVFDIRYICLSRRLRRSCKVVVPLSPLMCSGGAESGSHRGLL